MAKLKILSYPEKILRKKSRRVIEISDEVKTLISDMLETMYENQGIGLAANQVGKDLRICVIDIKPEGRPSPVVLINPEITSSSGVEYLEEGCLSFPGVIARIKRKKFIRVKALNPQGLPLEFSADGLLSRAIQHEIDHLNGKVFLDHLPLFKRVSVFRKYKKMRAKNKE